jgi:nucleoside-diphosphate-sugar epimerase
VKVLITGSAGFVGRNFVNRLKDEGHSLTQVDICDRYLPRDARDYFRNDETKFDLVIHLAAVVGGRVQIEGDPLSLAVDLSVDAEMFSWALRTRPGRIVYYSSSAAYPVSLQMLSEQIKLEESDIDLEQVGTPDMVYGWSKLTGELLASYAEKQGLRVHVFRPFSGYGEDQSPDYPFPAFIARAKNREDPFTVWGDGNQVRDFIHIDDVVRATLEAVKQDVPGPVNLGWGRATSFNELAEMVCYQAGYSPEFRHILDAPAGVSYRVCQPSKMLSFYKPKISLEQGIERALNA